MGGAPGERLEADVAGVVAAFALADPAWAPDLVRRLRPAVVDALEHPTRLPDVLLDAVVASGDPGLHHSLAHHPCLPPGTACALARLGNPGLGVALYTAPHTDLAVRAAVLAAADPTDARWREPGGLVELLLGTQADARLVPALRAPFPDVAAHALRILGPDLAPGEDVTFRLRTLLLGLRHLGVRPPRSEQYADDTDEAWNPDFAVHAHRTFPALPASEVDWALIRAEHARHPFDGLALAAFTQRPDCPEDLASLAYREHRNATLARAWRVPLDWITAVDPHSSDAVAWQAPLARGLAEGWLDPRDVLDRVAPAHRVFTCVPLDAPGVREACAELAAELGTDAAAWAALVDLRVNYMGTARDLVASAAGRHGRAARQVTFAYPPATPNPVETAFLVLFACAAPDVRDATLPVLPQRALDLLAMQRTDGTDEAPKPPDSLFPRPGRDSAPHAVRALVSWAGQSRTWLREPDARALVRHVRAQLDSVEAWVVAVRLLPGFTGTLHELLDVTAAAMSQIQQGAGNRV